jgi:MFS family permease
MSASQSVFALYCQHAYNFSSFTTGLTFAATGVFAVINQTLLLRSVWLKYFTESQLEVIMTIILGVSFFLLGFDILALFYVGLPLFATGQSIQRVVITSEITGRTDPLMKGEALGILTSLMAASMVVGPMIGGALFEIHDSYPFFLAGALMIISLIIALRYRRSPDYQRRSTAVPSGSGTESPLR